MNRREALSGKIDTWMKIAPIAATQVAFASI